MSTTTFIPRRVPAAHGPDVPVTADLTRLQTVLVNLYLYGPVCSPDWVLIDAGIPGFASRIIDAACLRFGDVPPRAILLTHGHFDHVGSLSALLKRWDVPVYAHPLELPYLTGRSGYPPPDPTAGGGLMSRTAPLFPHRPYDFRPHARALPEDGSVPGMPGWRWIHTPGHTPGHVSFFRDSDRTLIAGDAFVTQKQESFWAVMTNAQALHGPPAYFTSDWFAAGESVARLAELEPEIAATGHGIPMEGPRLRWELHDLADHFIERAVPRDGRYVRQPARADATGPTFIPPARIDATQVLITTLPLAAAAGLALKLRSRSRRKYLAEGVRVIARSGKHKPEEVLRRLGASCSD